MNKQISYIFNSKAIRIIGFVLVFIFLVNFVFARMVEDSRDQKLLSSIEYVKSNPKKEFDIMFFSNSYLYTAYDPMYLKYLTGYSSIHFGTSARRFCFEPYIMDEIIKLRRPKIVVLDISNGILRKPIQEKYLFHNIKGIASVDLSFSKIEAIYKYIPKDKWFQTFSGTTSVLYQLTTAETFSNNNTNVNLKKGETLGFMPMTGSFLKESDFSHTFDSLYAIPPNDNIQRSYTIDTESNEELNSVIKYFEKNKDIQLLLISSLKINSKLENQRLIDSLKTELNSHQNINILELNSKKIKNELALTLKDFSSHDHLMLSGAYKVTNFLGSYIKNNYLTKSLLDSNKVGSFRFDNDVSDNEIEVKYLEILANKNFNREIRLVINKKTLINKSNIATGINLYPKKGYEKLLSENSIEKDAVAENLYMPLSNYEIVGDDMIARIINPSNLNESQIDYIELWFWDAKNKITTNRIKITL